MKEPNKRRWLDGKEFSYVVSWGCIVLASVLLIPLIIASPSASVSAKITWCIVFSILFLMGVYSLVMEFLDYLESKKMEAEEDEEALK